MAVRDPISFNQYIDVNQLMPREHIVTTESTKIIDDQTYILDTQKLEISDMFYPKRINSEAFVKITEYDFPFRNLCGVDTVQAIFWNCLTWADGTITGWTIRLTDGVNNADIVATVYGAVATHMWRGPGFNAAFNCDGTVNNIEIQVGSVTGSGYAYVAGVCAWSTEK